MSDISSGALLAASISMDFTPLHFATASIVVFLLSFIATQDEHSNLEWSIIGAGLLIIYWAVNNVVYYTSPLWMYVITDTLFTVLYAYFFRESRKFFMAAITSLMAPNIFLDATYLINRVEYPRMMYWENWLLAAMLFVTGLNGLNVFITIGRLAKPLYARGLRIWTR